MKKPKNFDHLLANRRLFSVRTKNGKKREKGMRNETS
jgi:hypothetical protein